MGSGIIVMDDDGTLLSAGTTGEAVLRGDNVTSGYANNLVANHKTFCNGWFRTGDQGYFDLDNHLFLNG